MKFGFHISIAGGLRRVTDRALTLGCGTAQIFSRNPRGWKYKPLDKDDVAQFKRNRRRAKISPVAIHMPYLPNLASPDAKLYKRSVESLAEELRRAALTGCEFVVTHIGKRLSLSENRALKKVAKAIDAAIERAQAPGVTLLLENTAGQGSEIGHSLEQIAQIIEQSSYPERLGLCFDTCHGFAAGYDIASAKGLDAMIARVKSLMGLKKLRLLHLNDAKNALGSRVDRHENIGQGYIGKHGFRLIVNHPKLRRLPGIMETPLKKEGDDARNMKVIRSLQRR